MQTELLSWKLTDILFLFLLQGDSFELEVRHGSEVFKPENVATPKKEFIGNCQTALDYLIFHIVIHLILIALDTFIAYELTNKNYPADWYICTIGKSIF